MYFPTSTKPEVMITQVGNINVHHSASESGSGLFFVDNVSTLLSEYSNVDALDIACGAGEFGYKLLDSNIAENCDFADIRSSCSASIGSTNTANSLTTNFYPSDCFDDIPSKRYDVIVCNPPHLISQSQHDNFVQPGWTQDQIDESRLTLLDQDLAFHNKFFNGLDTYLEVSGSALLFENQFYIPSTLLTPLISSKYQYSKHIIDNPVADFYALKIKRIQEWLN